MNNLRIDPLFDPVTNSLIISEKFKIKQCPKGISKM